MSPSVGSPLTGFAARQGVAKGVHDDLFVRTLAMTDGEHSLAIVSVDVLALSASFVHRVRRAIRSRAGLSPDCVMVAATHTHSGPVSIRTFSNPTETVDGSYMKNLSAAIVESVDKAWQARFPARIGSGNGVIRDLGKNRRTSDLLPVDEEVGILRIDDAQGRARALVVNHPCHPTVLGPNNLLVSADFPGFMISRLESALGPGGFAMFLNGAEADVSISHSSELTAIGIVSGDRTFERAAEVGGALATVVLETLPEIAPEEEGILAAATLDLVSPFKKLPSLDEAAATLVACRKRAAELDDLASEEGKQARKELLYAEITYFHAREAHTDGGRVKLVLQAFRINDLFVLGLPGEAFVEIGLRIKQIAPRSTFVVGLANGYAGYIPTSEAFGAGGYEVVSAKCGPGTEALLLTGARQLYERLFTGRMAAGHPRNLSPGRARKEAKA
ncbi:MAG: neutral/alkaline non-lysosomal ceramidase N-terminal domain-containing protein [Acidobacteriota bacterium]